MNTIKRAAPVIQFLLILPASLFMLALIVRTLGPLQVEAAHTAQEIVTWYAGRMWTLWVLLGALPLAALGIGCATLLQQRRAGPPALLVAMLTLASAVILFIVGLHVLMN
ncbi:MAG TPA: hypothetical protein VMJ64_14685 [Anaerolineales bacterium]|nr:hypothetical protein [Anaerolineales bacterium]